MCVGWVMCICEYESVSLHVRFCALWVPSVLGALLQPFTTSSRLTSPQAASDRMLVRVQTFVQPALDQHLYPVPGCLSTFISSHTFTNSPAAQMREQKRPQFRKINNRWHFYNHLYLSQARTQRINNINEIDFHCRCQDRYTFLACCLGIT